MRGIVADTHEGMKDWEPSETEKRFLGPVDEPYWSRVLEALYYMDATKIPTSSGGDSKYANLLPFDGGYDAVDDHPFEGVVSRAGQLATALRRLERHGLIETEYVDYDDLHN